VKVLMHCVYYPPEVGGLESHVAELARGMVEAGHEVRVVTSRSIKGLPREEVVDGVQVYRSWFPSRSPLGWIAHALASIPRTRSWAGWADIVHAQAFASIVPAGVAARSHDRPLVATFHTSHFLSRAQRPMWRSVLSRLVRRPGYALAASKEIAEVAMALAPGVQVEALTNGVDTDRFHPAAAARPPRPGVRQIVVPRRLFQKNGVEYFVRAMPRILERVTGVQALVIGDGPERERLVKLAEELGVRSEIEFLGSRPHSEMPGLLSSGELAVFPSLMEATSVAALECMACGLPVVATRVGGLPEIVDESVGRLVKPADPDDLARGVIEVLESDSLEEKGEAARARVVAEWSNARLVERHLEIYRTLLDPAGSDPSVLMGNTE
jgi:glycosyltransferase involved in cell wall biosynthesis